MPSAIVFPVNKQAQVDAKKREFAFIARSIGWRKNGDLFLLDSVLGEVVPQAAIQLQQTTPLLKVSA